MRPIVPVLALTVCLASVSRAALDDVLGIWQLDNSLEEASGGTALAANNFVPVYTTSSIGGSDATVLDLAPLDPTQTLALTNIAGANGGGGAVFTNNWTLVMDVNLETISTFQSLVQTNVGNTNDVDIFVRPGGALGTLDFGPNVTEAGAVGENQWYRLVFTSGNDGNGGGLRNIAYIDGMQTTIGGVPQVAASGFEGVFSLDTIVNLFSDESSETDDMLVNSIAFWGEELSAAEVGLLGAASAGGISIPEDPKICPSQLTASVTGAPPNPTVDLDWRAAEGLDSTGIEVSLDGNVLGATTPDATSFSHSPTIVPNGGFVDLVYSLRMTGGADSADCDPLDVTVSFFTGDLNTDLVLYLPLDADGSDLSGRGNHGAINGAPSFGPGQIGNAMTLTDPADPHQYHVFHAAADDLRFGTDVDFSVSAWVNNSTGFPDNMGIGGSGSDPAIISNKDWTSGGNPGWIIAAGPDGRWQWNLNGEGGARADYDGPAGQISDGIWHHLFVSHDRDGDATMFYDGQQVATRSIAGRGNIDAGGFGTGVGTDGTQGTGFPGWFPGSIDEVAIWRRVVAPDEVAGLYQMGLAGTPLVAGAPFAITSVSYNAATLEVTITFNSQPGAEYALDHSDDLTNWNEIDDGVGSDGEQTTISFQNPGQVVNTNRQYFRLRIPE